MRPNPACPDPSPYSGHHQAHPLLCENGPVTSERAAPLEPVDLKPLCYYRSPEAPAMEYKDYYKTLGVDKKATAQEIKAAYRKLARKHHPDFNPGDKKAEARFKELNEAN